MHDVDQMTTWIFVGVERPIWLPPELLFRSVTFGLKPYIKEGSWTRSKC